MATVVASAARTVGGNSGPQSVEPEGSLAVEVEVTAVSGTTPSLAVTVEWSDDGGATFAKADTPDAMSAITAVSNQIHEFPVLAPMYRIVWAITGTTPSVTFSVDTDKISA